MNTQTGQSDIERERELRQEIARLDSEIERLRNLRLNAIGEIEALGAPVEGRDA